MPPPHHPRGGFNHPHYSQYSQQPHTAGLPPPSLSNPGFMNPISGNNPFSNGNGMGITSGFGGHGLGMPGGTGLASREAQQVFHNGRGSKIAPQARIRDVWKHNLEEEMGILRQLVQQYPYIAMDTEFPGIVARPMGNFSSSSDYHYQTLRINVDMLKIIQLGITLFTEKGELPPDSAEIFPVHGTRKRTLVQIPCTWQFNFAFSIETDMYSHASIKLLEAAGVELDRLERDGIDPNKFAAALNVSGLVMDENVTWISFHGGYDFGYLTKLLTISAMPENERQFHELMKKFFPTIYDIKFLMKRAIRQLSSGQQTPDEAKNMLLRDFESSSSLGSLATALSVPRHGVEHQAGSDSLVTGHVFFKIRARIFNSEIPNEYMGKVWGIGIPDHQHQSAPQHYHQTHNAASQNGADAYSNGAPSTPNNQRILQNPANASGVSPAVNGNHTAPTTTASMGNFSAFQFATPGR
ncbi:CAF1 family ribonuclease [Calycina marina]|uniref:poly(A)-specific ribonuclease n=1 Tax=Calycina marina TaxID=1763456 RepID=A0A9P7YX73_9HELO|nr:CAF1 family ribonuclease [Calycina marina]